ncbi:MAG: hypothetical protein ACLRV9_08395 [Clostridium sp.]
MDAETKEMLQAILAGMDGLEEKINQKIETEIRGVKVLVENDVGKRIDSLFDGYKLAHEKQWELERRIEELEKRLARLAANAG